MNPNVAHRERNNMSILSKFIVPALTCVAALAMP